jgi:hypothetical protein
LKTESKIRKAVYGAKPPSLQKVKDMIESLVVYCADRGDLILAAKLDDIRRELYADMS